MNKILPLFVFIFSFHLASSQEDTVVKESDSLYKEDQFYIGVTYNLLGNKPNGVSQSGFSSGFHLGFIKDMPINIRRNVAIGLGLGVSANSFNQNMLIDKADGQFVYSVLDENEISYSKNKFTTYVIEAPLEFRWRTSTASEYKFWRIYTGIKFGYVVANSSKYKGEPQKIKHSNIDEFNAFQYGLTISVGYNTWNLHLYYGLNPVFNSDAKINDERLQMNAIKIGLMLYLL
ncbi:porin family protein [Lacinutrix iliipiscaria]|uniref:Porin family protein n=1 Tax=Lacinutrix iliipiscaria TaxID=1230532 RepID=A0ABW5WK60_9FLAO